MELLALEESIAQIDGTGYESLEAAIEAAQEGDTIMLLDDAVVPNSAVVIGAGKEFTLDLNGHTIMPENAGGRILRIEGALTLKDSSGGVKKFEITGGKFTGTVFLDDSLKEKIQDGTYHGISGGYFSEEVDEGCITPGCELLKEDEEVKNPEDDKSNSEDKNNADKGNGATNGSGANSETVYQNQDQDSDDSYAKPDPNSGEWRQDAIGWWYQFMEEENGEIPFGALIRVVEIIF